MPTKICNSVSSFSLHLSHSHTLIFVHIWVSLIQKFVQRAGRGDNNSLEDIPLKVHGPEILSDSFFHSLVSPRALIVGLQQFWFLRSFTEKPCSIHVLRFMTGVNDTDHKLIARVSRTPVINLSPMSVTLGINLHITGVNDTGDKSLKVSSPCCWQCR